MCGYGGGVGVGGGWEYDSLVFIIYLAAKIGFETDMHRKLFEVIFFLGGGGSKKSFNGGEKKNSNGFQENRSRHPATPK